jgi:pyrimidine-nucleoside phosphorylase
MRMVDLIRKKRDGQELNQDEIDFIIKGIVSGNIPEYQATAWLMAVYFKGMNFDETAHLTRSMINSGAVLRIEGLRPLVDKHSTGGVGDKISLPLAPLAAACGLIVPMMSGRGLGHTGGTLDKLESMVGYSTQLKPESVEDILHKCGYAMFGQSKDVVPADRTLYALRDVTATVESIPLITASILSKKFAEGAEGLVFDVKCGRGAFMKDEESALKLAKSLTQTAAVLGKKAVAVVTAMDEPLGRMIGNWLEVEESLDVLEGRGPADVNELVIRLNAWMLVLGGLVKSVEEGIQKSQDVLATSRPLELFLKNVALQGGNPDAVMADRLKRRAYYSQVFEAPKAGWVQGWDSLGLGLLASSIGAGRSKVDDKIAFNAGIQLLAKKGERVEKGQPLCLLWVDNDALLSLSLEQVANLVSIQEEPVAPVKSLILHEVMGA